MAEFTLHIRLDADETEQGDGKRLLDPFLEEHEDVTYGDERVRPQSDAEVVPEHSSLEIEGVETYAEIYTALREEPIVRNLSLWGPSAERFPVPVQHYANQQIQNPDLYEYHALDDQVTLVVAESEMEAQQVQREVPEAAIGYSESPF